MLSTFIKLPFVIKFFVLSIFEWSLKTGFTVLCYRMACVPWEKTHIYFVTLGKFRFQVPQFEMKIVFFLLTIPVL